MRRFLALLIFAVAFSLTAPVIPTAGSSALASQDTTKSESNKGKKKTTKKSGTKKKTSKQTDEKK